MKIIYKKAKANLSQPKSLSYANNYPQTHARGLSYSSSLVFLLPSILMEEIIFLLLITNYQLLSYLGQQLPPLGDMIRHLTIVGHSALMESLSDTQILGLSHSTQPSKLYSGLLTRSSEYQACSLILIYYSFKVITNLLTAKPQYRRIKHVWSLADCWWVFRLGITIKW